MFGKNGSATWHAHRRGERLARLWTAKRYSGKGSLTMDAKKSFSRSSVYGGPPRIKVMPNSLKEVLAEALSRIKMGAAALYLDFDGTLAPLAPEPSEARMDEPARRALSRILGTKRMVVCVISGRALGDLQQRVGLE